MYRSETAIYPDLTNAVSHRQVPALFHPIRTPHRNKVKSVSIYLNERGCIRKFILYSTGYNLLFFINLLRISKEG